MTIKRWSWLVAALLVIVGAALLQPFEIARSGANRVVGAVVLVVAAVFIANLLLAGRAEISRMRRSIDRAQEIVSGRAEIAQMVAHEVRGPVTTIRGLAETSIRHYERLGDPERREFLRLIEEEARRLLRVVDQTSTAFGIDAGTLTYRVQPEDLASAVREGVSLASADAHPVRLSVEAGIRLPLDRAHLADAIRQLVDNASLYSPADSPIEVRSYRDDDAAVVEVIDAGPGIAPEHRERVFTKFPGVRPSGFEAAPGTGLGLFICRAHVRRHGGEVVAADGPEGGTMLRITLPQGGAEERGR